MRQKRVTVRDIAERLNVSSGTVHRALNGKPGVGEELRALIQETAKELGYRTNYLAATLKMNPLRIVLAFPQQAQGNNFYYRLVWQGCRTQLQAYADYPLEVIEAPFTRDGLDESQSFTGCMERILAQYQHAVDGVLVGGLMRGRDAAMVQRLYAEGIPIVMLCEGIAEECGLCTVQGDHYADGQMAAELLRGHIAPGGKILVCAGSPELASNSENHRGFLDSLGSEYQVRSLYGVFERENLEKQLHDCLRSERFQGAYSVAARSTPLLCHALEQAGLAREICAVGSDLFPETALALQRGTLNYVIFKRPNEQGARGLEILLDYLISHTPPQKGQTQIHSVIVIRSNLKFYQTSIEKSEKTGESAPV